MKFCFPVIAGLALAVSACQPLPHPFARDDDTSNTLLTLPVTFGVLVEPVQNIDSAIGQALAENMAGALQDIEVPASTKAGNRGSFKLSGTASSSNVAGSVRFQIAWTMESADGKQIGTDVEKGSVPAKEWQAGAGQVLNGLAKTEAPKLASFIREAPPVERSVDRHILVKPVAGAPGDGEKSLQNALIYALKQQGMDVVENNKAPRTITIKGGVTLTSISTTQDHIRIVWHVLTPDGTDVAQATQENNIPHGMLSRPWGTLAVVIANAAVDDILKIVLGTTLSN